MIRPPVAAVFAVIRDATDIDIFPLTLARTGLGEGQSFTECETVEFYGTPFFVVFVKIVELVTVAMRHPILHFLILC